MVQSKCAHSSAKCWRKKSISNYLNKAPTITSTIKPDLRSQNQKIKQPGKRLQKKKKPQLNTKAFKNERKAVLILEKAKALYYLMKLLYWIWNLLLSGVLNKPQTTWNQWRKYYYILWRGKSNEEGFFSVYAFPIPNAMHMNLCMADSRRYQEKMQSGNRTKLKKKKINVLIKNKGEWYINLFWKEQVHRHAVNKSSWELLPVVQFIIKWATSLAR